jgi:hypothetical protein
MNTNKAQVGCQLQTLNYLPDPNAEVIMPPLPRRLKLALVRRLDPNTKRRILERIDRLATWFAVKIGRRANPAVSAPRATALQAGDLVRVRSREEIEGTLNSWRQLKGCTFMEEMAPYCGTTQRVLKPVNRFLDERDYRIKKCKGIILLEGLMCQGTETFGPCDRACFFFWREEWLERID